MSLAKILLIGIAAAMVAVVPASAQVVALGASNTAGSGVGPERAYPAVVERLLRARGINVSVVNRGVHGATTGEMLARLDQAVPSGTRVVIFQPGGNDATEAQRRQGVASITQRLTARGIRIVLVTTALRNAARGNVQMDGIHLTVRGHEILAQGLAPQVARALGR